MKREFTQADAKWPNVPTWASAAIKFFKVKMTFYVVGGLQIGENTGRPSIRLNGTFTTSMHVPGKVHHWFIVHCFIVSFYCKWLF